LMVQSECISDFHFSTIGAAQQCHQLRIVRREWPGF
jgi:hypothetical protein